MHSGQARRLARYDIYVLAELVYLSQATKAIRISTCLLPGASLVLFSAEGYIHALVGLLQ